MRKHIGYTIVLITLFTMALMFSGCKSAAPPVTFYTLTAMQTQDLISSQKYQENALIGIGPARFPKLIDRPQIVTRTAANKVDLAEFHRWGGSLNQEFINVLAENIILLTGSRQVLVYPWSGTFSPTWQIGFDVHQFDGTLGGSVLLNVTWTIKEANSDSKNVVVKKSVINQPVTGNGYDALVKAQSMALETLSLQIIKEKTKMGR